MTIFRKSIFTAASPNSQIDDAWLAFRLLLHPWNWRNGQWAMGFEQELREYLRIDHVITVDSGRSAIEIALKALGVKTGDEVITPSFTCIVVPNAVFYTGARSIFLDTNLQDLNGDYDHIEKYISPRSKAILVQHTFGKMVDVNAIRNKLFAINRPDIKIIEDFAHVIHRNMKIHGDIGILTFGIEKVISSVRGGAIVTNNSDIFKQIQDTTKDLPVFPASKTLVCLLNPIFWFFAIPLHSVGFGRFTIGAFIRSIWRKLGFLGIMVEHSENHVVKPNWFPAKMSPALARLGSKQLKKLDKFNEHRARISEIYSKYLGEISDEGQMINDKEESARVYLRYPIILNSSEEYLKVWNTSRRLRVTLGNWFAIPLYGAGVGSETYKKLGYDPETTPETVRKCKLVLNLPTSVNISEKRAEELGREIRAKLY